MIDVSCIIINYNTSSLTADAVESIIEKHRESNIKFEIVVIDNASDVEDYENLKKRLSKITFDNVQLIRSKINTGFGGGNMLGVQASQPCHYYAFINNDTLQVSQNCLDSLVAFMQSTKDAGICSPQMLDEHGNFRVTIDHFSSLQREILRRPILEKLFPKTYLNRKIEYSKPTKVQYVQGSFLFVDSHLFHDIGGFDTNLFLYYEESDLCLRALRKHQKYCYLLPNLKYVHYKSASIKRGINIKIEQKISLLYHTIKHYGWWAHKLLLIYLSIRYFFSSLFKPKYWKLFLVLIIGAPLTKSLKHKQKINY